MKFRLEIQCVNAAFGDSDEGRAEEVGRILESTVRALRGGVVQYKILFDVNGNAVGTASFTDKP
jgi:hypothetical protein